jgi:hypothetical protein
MMGKKPVVSLSVLLLMLIANPVFANDTISGEKGTDMVVDALVVRPVGLVSVVLGTAVTIISLPFTLPSGSVGAAAQAMIVEPAEYTFNRSLGEFHHCGQDRHPCGASDR